MTFSVQLYNYTIPAWNLITEEAHSLPLASGNVFISYADPARMPTPAETFHAIFENHVFRPTAEEGPWKQDLKPTAWRHLSPSEMASYSVNMVPFGQPREKAAENKSTRIDVKPRGEADDSKTQNVPLSMRKWKIDEHTPIHKVTVRITFENMDGGKETVEGYYHSVKKKWKLAGDPPFRNLLYWETIKQTSQLSTDLEFGSHILLIYKNPSREMVGKICLRDGQITLVTLEKRSRSSWVESWHKLPANYNPDMEKTDTGCCVVM